MKALIGVFVLFACSMAQYRLKPFKIGIISSLEHREMLSTLITLYGGLIFVQENQLSGLSIAFFVLIVIINARFWILWIYCMITVYKSKWWVEVVRIWFKKAFCINVSTEDEDYLCYKSKSQSTSQGIKSNLKSSNITKLNIKNSDYDQIRHSNRNDSNVTYEVIHVINKNENENENTLRSIRTPKSLLESEKGKHDTIESHHKVIYKPNAAIKRRKQKKPKNYTTKTKEMENFEPAEETKVIFA